MEQQRLRHLNQRANGLKESTLPLWTRALGDMPIEQEHERSTKATTEVLRLRVQRAAQSLKAAEELQKAKKKLEAAKLQKTIDKHQKAVQWVQSFLQSNPAVVADLQSAGIDFGAVSREALQAAEDAVEAISDENHKIIADLRTLEKDSDEKNSLFNELTAEVD